MWLWPLAVSWQVQHQRRADMDRSQLHQHLCVRRWTTERTRRWDAGYDVSVVRFTTTRVWPLYPLPPVAKPSGILVVWIQVRCLQTPCAAANFLTLGGAQVSVPSHNNPLWVQQRILPSFLTPMVADMSPGSLSASFTFNHTLTHTLRDHSCHELCLSNSLYLPALDCPSGLPHWCAVWFSCIKYSDSRYFRKKRFLIQQIYNQEMTDCDTQPFSKQLKSSSPL